MLYTNADCLLGKLKELKTILSCKL